MQRWSKHVTETLRTFLRRGALLLLAPLIAVLVTVSPIGTKPAAAAITDFGLGGNSCAIETVGWVICPTMRTIARLADKGFAYINQNSLKINYALFDTTGKTYQAWEIMRNIANGLFVIVFLYMIYNYLIGRVNGTYSLKRLLPRLLIAAIIINVSFYIGVILTDLTNIIGDAIWAIMKGIYGNGSPVMPIDKAPSPLTDGNLTKLTSTAMGNTALVWVLMPIILAVVLSIAVISGVMVILLIMRQALVAMLILAAPILIVLYLLPNLEKYSGQAMRLFLQLLLLYPIIAVLLGAGQIASLAATSWSTTAFYGGGSMSIATDIVGAGVAVLPLLGLWFVFKYMSTFMNAAGSRISASIRSRRGGDDEKAQVTGKATLGAAKLKLPTGIGNGLPGRRQAFTRNRRRASMGASSLTGDESRRKNDSLSAASAASSNLDDMTRNNVMNNETNSLSNSEQNSLENTEQNLTQNQLEEMQKKTIEEQEKKGVGGTVAQAVLGAKGREDDDKKDKGITAKDLFNNLNHAHKSKDQDRKFGAGPGVTGGGGGVASAGSAQPSAPVVGFRAPDMAQNSNIVSGSAAGQAPTQIIAVPVQVDTSSLLGGNQSHAAGNMAGTGMQPPVTGTEEKAKARAQKYLFDAEQDLENDRDRQDILGKKDAPDEQPHVPKQDDKGDD